MKIIVTGGMGFVGRWLVAEMAGEHELTLLTRQAAPARLEWLGRQAVCRQTDYATPDLCKALAGADALVHLAAIRPHPGIPAAAFETNRTLSAAVLEACYQVGISNLVLLSSRAVYGKARPWPWTEEMIPQPEGAYGQSKLDMEQLAGEYEARGGMKIKSLRMSQLAGLGERTAYALMTFVQAANAGKVLQVYSTGADGREYLYVRDAAAAIRLALQHPQESGIFNIGSEAPISILELARLVNRVFENEGKLVAGEQALEMGEMRWMNNQKARQVLQWQPAWSLEAALQEMRSLLRLPPGAAPA